MFLRRASSNPYDERHQAPVRDDEVHGQRVATFQNDIMIFGTDVNRCV